MTVSVGKCARLKTSRGGLHKLVVPSSYEELGSSSPGSKASISADPARAARPCAAVHRCPFGARFLNLILQGTNRT
ncbi:hypothetical protein VTK56DRAFT_7575 [Thermocarpiscus australiensis]